VTGFLGGITFAAMILIIQNMSIFDYKIPFEISIPAYPKLLITGTAIISVLFIVPSVGYIRAAAGEFNVPTTYTRYLGKLAEVGFYLLIIGLLPALILPFSTIGAAIVFIFSLVTVLVMAALYSKN